MAFHYFDQSLGLEPKNEAALLNRARILEEMGQSDLARHAYQEILFQNRQHPVARRKIAEYQSPSEESGPQDPSLNHPHGA
jgi:tetratricopeptide (TPR) repeat protein